MLHHVGRGALVATPIFTSPVFARRWSSSALLYNPASFAMLRSVSPAAYPSPNPDLTLACATSRARDECAHFCLWTGWVTQRLSIPTELSFTRCRLTPRARILITGSSVVEMRCCATSGAGQGGRKSCALMTGEVAEPFRWLCSTGYMLKLFHSSSLPCFSEVLWRPTVRRCPLKKMLASHGCVGLCVPLWAKCPLYSVFPQPHR